jgi:hypothetical protein
MAVAFGDNYPKECNNYDSATTPANGVSGRFDQASSMNR